MHDGYAHWIDLALDHLVELAELEARLGTWPPTRSAAAPPSKTDPPLETQTLAA
jgi:hypothetical protein